jgi:hypothetical protein
MTQPQPMRDVITVVPGIPGLGAGQRRPRGLGCFRPIGREQSFDLGPGAPGPEAGVRSRPRRPKGRRQLSARPAWPPHDSDILEGGRIRTLTQRLLQRFALTPATAGHGISDGRNAFLQYRRLKEARREKTNQRSTAATDIAGRTPSHPRSLRSATTSEMPALPKMDWQQDAA